MTDPRSDNRARYNRLSRFYETMLKLGSFGSIGQMYKALAHEIEPCPGGTIVELGCGPGNVTPYLLPLVGDSGSVIGVDLSDGMIEKAKARAERSGWKNVRYERCDVLEFKTEVNADAVVFSLALSTMPECRRCLDKALSILAPGGRLAILDSMPEPERPFANWIIHRKAPRVGAAGFEAAQPRMTPAAIALASFSIRDAVTRHTIVGQP